MPSGYSILKAVSFQREPQEESLEEAIKQINERKYETEILKRGIRNIMKLAIVFDGKEVWVKKG